LDNITDAQTWVCKGRDDVSALRTFAASVAVLTLALGATQIRAAEEEARDPSTISEADAINCYIGAPEYNGFALSIEGEDSIARARKWRKIESNNPFMNEYELPEPILVTGNYSTRRIAFTSNAIIAILDLADPTPLAKAEQIENAYDPGPLIDALVASGKVTRQQAEAEIKFHKFLGERIIVETVEGAPEEQSYNVHTTIARTISNATTHPGKTFYGCTYRMDLLGKDGKPL
jgi:hypothetical protein